MIFATLLTSVCFVSCSDDDEKGESLSEESLSGIDNPLQNEGKMLLSSITCNEDWAYTTYCFEYDGKYRPIGHLGIDDESLQGEYVLQIDYDKGLIWRKYKSNSLWTQEQEPEVYDSVTFTDKGYIASEKWRDENDFGEMNYSYDKYGHLIKETNFFTYESSNEKEIVQEVTNYTWENGNLISCLTEGIDKETENGKTISSEPFLVKYSFTYGNQPNKYKQYSAFFYSALDFRITGLYGTFSKNLPETFELYRKHGDKDWFGMYKAEFTLNNDGTINTETWTRLGYMVDTFTYQYKPIGQYSTMVPAFAKSAHPSKATSAKEKKHKMRRLGRFPYMSKKGHRQANAQD